MHSIARTILGQLTFVALLFCLVGCVAAQASSVRLTGRISIYVALENRSLDEPYGYIDIDLTGPNEFAGRIVKAVKLNKRNDLKISAGEIHDGDLISFTVSSEVAATGPISIKDVRDLKAVQILGRAASLPLK